VLEDKYHDRLKRIGFYNLGNKIVLADIIAGSNTLKKMAWVSKKALGFVLRRTRKKNLMHQNEIFQDFIIKNYNKLYSNEYENLKFVYIFDNGSVVYWNFQEEEELAMNNMILKTIEFKSEYIANEYYFLEKTFYEDEINMFITDHIQSNIIFLKVG
jgi:uncharacterized Rmd1/YagE family protein